MADFKKALAKTLKDEGGYVDIPEDRGGPTKYGISQRSYPGKDIKELSLDDAAEIYRREYWDYLTLNWLFSQAVAEEVFDTSVLMGTKRAVEIVQRSLNYLGEKLIVDGILGARTLSAINGYPYESTLIKTLNGVQFQIFLKIVEADPSQSIFSVGWLKRINLGGGNE